MNRKYISTSELPTLFGKSQDWFRNRIGVLFVMGNHVFQPEKKGGLFWDINAVDEVIRGNRSLNTEPLECNELIQSLLQ